MQKASVIEYDVPSLLERTQSTLALDVQIFLAHSLAKAVLQFHATPWMANEWRLKDFAFFQADNEEISQSVQTMHMTAKFQDQTDLNCPTSSPNLDSPDTSDAQYLYGVPNLILFSLGVALLEIGHKQPLEVYQKDRDPNLTVTARRLAQLPSALGQKYQLLAQRCLRCDFGHGSELDKEELQIAVYNDVVLPLSDILEALRI